MMRKAAQELIESGRYNTPTQGGPTNPTNPASGNDNRQEADDIINTWVG